MDYDEVKRLIALTVCIYGNEYKTSVGETRTPEEEASDIISRLCEDDVQWFKKETDESTLKDVIVLTPWSIMLAGFLQELSKNSEPNYTTLMYDVYTSVDNEEYWVQDAFQDGLMNIFEKTRQFSRALRPLSIVLRVLLCILAVSSHAGCVWIEILSMVVALHVFVVSLHAG